jgi:ribosomal protein S18 acetylase RimI-like enzyme
LAVDSSFREKYHGIGSFMINIAIGFAQNCNDEYLSCRFLAVDADVENDKGIAAFYQKNGFVNNNELNNPRRKTLSMRKDIYS